MVIGSTGKLGFAVGRKEPQGQLRKIEIFLFGRKITNENNRAYLPSFISALSRDMVLIQTRKIGRNYSFMELEDITDSFLLRVWLSNGSLLIKEFHRNQWCTVGVLPVGYVVETFKKALKYLEHEKA